MEGEPAKVEATNKTTQMVISVITYDKLKKLLQEYAPKYGLQTMDDLLDFLMENQNVVK